MQSVGLPKVRIKLLKLSHAGISSHPKILFLVPLLFVVSIPTYLLNFEFFSLFAFYIHDINLSADTQSITGAYIMIMLVCRCLLTTCLPGKAAV